MIAKAKDLFQSDGFREFGSLAAKASLFLLKTVLLMGSTIAFAAFFAHLIATGALELFVSSPSYESIIVLSLVLVFLFAFAGQQIIFPRIRYTVASSSIPSQSMATLAPRKKEVNRDVARHEGAHLVTALHFGEKIFTATIISTGNSKGHISIPSWSTGDHSVEASRDRLWGNLLIRMAGTVCDQLDNRQDFGSSEDMRTIEELLPMLMSVRYGAKADGFPLASSELHHRGLRHTRAILQANAEAVDLAARFLIEHETITEDTKGDPIGKLKEIIVQVADPQLSQDGLVSGSNPGS